MNLYFDEFDFDPEQLELRRAGQAIKAEPVVLRLLAVLVRNAGKLVPKQELIAQVWDGRVVADNVVTVAMVRLRKTLGHKAGEREFIENVQRRGYRFVAPVAQQPPQLRARLTRPAAALAPFVGRERLLHALRDALADAERGHGNACVLTGEPGIGKTRAVEVLAHELVASKHAIAWGHCRESGDTPPLWPFTQILRQLLAVLADGTRGTGIDAWARTVPELVALLPELAPPGAAHRPISGGGELTQGAELTRHVAFDAIVQFMLRASALRPLVIVLDDLQRADAASFELLELWIDQLPHTRVLLLATLNRLDISPAIARAQLAYVYGHRNTTRLSLERLNEEDVSLYVRALIDDPDGELARVVFRQSEGNPFFMSELARQLRHREYSLPGELTLPHGALEHMKRRLVVLDEAARGALSCAAVIGRRFELPVLQALTGADTTLLMAALDQALLHSVVLDEVDGGTAFTFAHELLRVALYDSLTPARRREMHYRLACVLEERLLAGSAVEVADLAFHFHAALPDTDLRKTVHYCAAAAIDSSKLFAYADSMRYLRHARQALELNPEASARLRLTLLMRQALCARVCGDPEFEPLTRALIRLATQRNSGAHLAWGAFLLDLNAGFPPLAGSREALEAALAALPQDDGATRAAILARLATQAPLAYDPIASTRQIEYSVELAMAAGVPVAVWAARSCQLYRAGGESDQTAANQALESLEQICRMHPLRLTVPPVLIELHRAIRALQTGDLAGLDSALERSAELCRKVGHRELRWHIERAQAVQRINVGDERTGIRALQLLHERAVRDTIPGALLFRAYDQCVISSEVSALSNAELRTALARDSADAPNIWSLKVRALARAGLHDEARQQLFEIAPERLLTLPHDRDYLGTLGALVHAVVELRAHAYIERLYELLASQPDGFAAHISFFCEGSITQLRGELAHSIGRHVEGAAKLTSGAALAERVGLLRAARRRPELHASR